MTVAACLGFRAQKGGAVVVGIGLEGGEPRLLLSAFLATAADGDRLALEPYHLVAELARAGKESAELREKVAEGRRRQDAAARAGLQAMLDGLKAADTEPKVAALLINRAGWVTDLLSYSLAFADHPPVAEGLAVREAIRTACAGFDLAIAETDEKSLEAEASKALGLTREEIEARLKLLGESAARPWRKEQKLASLAAWCRLVGAVEGPARQPVPDTNPIQAA